LGLTGEIINPPDITRDPSVAPGGGIRWAEPPFQFQWPECFFPYNFRGGAYELFLWWWAERDARVTRDITIEGDTPFTLELRQAEHFRPVRRGIIERLHSIDRSARLGGDPIPATIDGRCTRSYGFREMVSFGPRDIWRMFIGIPVLGANVNVADTFLGSFDGTYEVSKIDRNEGTAKVTFDLRNSTNWASATRIYIPGHGATSVFAAESGAQYRQRITWTETVRWCPYRTPEQAWQDMIKKIPTFGTQLPPIGS
jgi:hypothetical protein